MIFEMESRPHSPGKVGVLYLYWKGKNCNSWNQSHISVEANLATCGQIKELIVIKD
jgi:hypothetical protein